jgi:predicted permease
VRRLRRLVSKLIDSVRIGRADAELAREINAHLALLEDDFLRMGMKTEDARRAARRAYGNVEQAKQMHRNERSLLWVEQLRQDLRYAIRQFRRSPGFTSTVILTIALGIGANTAIFTLIHSILLRSLPVADPNSLYRIGDAYTDCCLTSGLGNENGDFDIFSWEGYRHLRGSTPEFDQLAAVQADQTLLSARLGADTAKSRSAEYVSGNYFTTLGVPAYAGRVFTDSDDQAGAWPVVVLSYRAWRADYAADPRLIGSTIYLQSQPVTVVGVAAPGFFGDRITANPPAFWLPLSDEPLLSGANSVLHQPSACWLYLLGRLHPGVPITPLQERISANLRGWLLTQNDYLGHGFPAVIAKVHVALSRAGAGIQTLQHQTRKKLYLLQAISLLVLLVSCANVANLMLARGLRRTTETSVRMALGSARSRLLRHMLTESVLLACFGGLAGLALACAGTQAMLALSFPNGEQSAIHPTPSPAVLGFAFLLSLGTGVAFGVVPAWISSRADPAEALRGRVRSIGDRASLPQRSMIVVQVAFALGLLMCASLLTRSLANLEHQSFGLKTDNRFVLHLDPMSAGHLSAEKLAVLYNRLEFELKSISGMEAVGLAMYSPLEGYQWTDGVFLPGRPLPGPNDDNDTQLDRVSPHFLDAIGHPVIRGRGLLESDNAQSPMVAVVNEAFAKKFFPHENPVGKRFGIYEQEDVGAYEIVGVVANAKYADPALDASAMCFEPLAQWQHKLTEPIFVNLEAQTHHVGAVVMHYHGSGQSLEPAVRRILTQIDPNLAIVRLEPLDSQLADNFSQERLVARLTALFALLALLLTSIGLYGITAYQTAQRSREIGLRMAFGADRKAVVTMVMRGALMQFVIGSALGIPFSVLGARLMENQLYQVQSFDPQSLAVAILSLAAATAAAAFIPARRAASIDPMRGLRNE